MECLWFIPIPQLVVRMFELQLYLPRTYRLSTRSQCLLKEEGGTGTRVRETIIVVSGGFVCVYCMQTVAAVVQVRADTTMCWGLRRRSLPCLLWRDRAAEVGHTCVRVLALTRVSASMGWCTKPCSCCVCVCVCVSLSAAPEVEELRVSQKKDRSRLVLWRRPVQTVHYFLRELFYEAQRLTYG